MEKSLVTLPVLILFLGLDEATANGTNRLMVISAALVASYGYRSKGIVRSEAKLQMCPVSPLYCSAAWV